MSEYVSKEQLDSLKKRIEDESEFLITNINSFNNEASNLDSVLKKLKVYYNTSGGEVSSSKIANTKFSSDKLSRIAKSVDSIEINYYTKSFFGDDSSL